MTPDQAETFDRFRSTAAHYLRGRPPYADRLIQRVAQLVGLQRTHDVLDLGCGPGQLARAFAPLSRTVVALDPQPEMLRIAVEVSAGFPSIRFVCAGSADLDPSLGRFRLVVMGRSFHWMDRAETLRRLDALVEPNGAVAHFDTEAADVPENAWMERYRAIRRRYSPAEPDRPRRRDGSWQRHEVPMLRSAFCQVEGVYVFERREFSAQTLIDRAFSMSSTSPDRLGERAADFCREIEALIAEIAPTGMLTEVIISNALLAFRPG
jgi:SAM-dependent methyltransferase